MITSEELCLGCMTPRDPGVLCPRCGYRHGSQPTSPLYFKPGGVLHDQYIVGRVLGHGGFGVTYLGYDAVLDRKIAIKEYLPSSIAARQTDTAQVSAHHDKLRGDFEFGLQRFLDEARTLARFQGFPNIIGVMTFFSANGTAYMVMEHLEGETFESYLERNGGRISFAAALSILTPVMDALREVHRQNILHRDISPDNIFLVNAGPVKLLDFGAARHAMSMRSGAFSVILKEGYAPEEQYSSTGEQGPWTDVYALAGTMYRALTGKIPPPALERRRAAELVPPSRLGSDIPPEAERVLLHALAVDAAERYRSVDEFQSALMGPSVAAVPPPAGMPAPPTVSPQRKLIPLLIAAALLLLAAGYTAYRAINRQPAQVTFTAADARIAEGQRTTIAWDVTHAARVEIDGIGAAPSKGSTNVTPHATTTYRLVATGNDGKPVEKSVRIQVVPAAPPPAPGTVPAPGIAFSALPGVIHAGEQVTLQWSFRNATSGEIQPAVGQLPQPSGQLTVRPAATTTYTLTARAADGSAVSSSATVQVLPASSPVPPPAPAPAPTPLRGGIGGSADSLLRSADPAKGQFVVFHQHGNIVGRPLAGYCAGILEVVGGQVTYRVSYSTDQRRDDFGEPVTSITESRQNRLGFLGRPAFHIRFKDGQNYNFAPQNTSVAHVLRILTEARR